MPTDRVPVVFIHGLWLHSTSWQPWAEKFRAAGYDPITPEWPGVPATVAEAREHPETQAGVGIDQVIDTQEEVVRGLGVPPALIGHSIGGPPGRGGRSWNRLVVLALLDRGRFCAGVAIVPPQIRRRGETPPASRA